MSRHRPTEQPEAETKLGEGQGITDAAADVILQPNPFEATRTRDMGLLCDNCKARLQRAHAEDERNRNAVYPEGVTP
jgi:hypothetical protein